MKYTLVALALIVSLGCISLSVSAAPPINFLINMFTTNLTSYINTTDLNVTPNAYFQIKSNSTNYVPCTGIYGGTDADFCTDATGAAGSGANVSTTTCAGTQKVSAINNATGAVTCSADVDTDTTFNSTYDAIRQNISNSTTYWAGLTGVPGEWAAVNTTAQMFAAANNNSFYPYSNPFNFINTSYNATISAYLSANVSSKSGAVACQDITGNATNLCTITTTGAYNSTISSYISNNISNSTTYSWCGGIFGNASNLCTMTYTNPFNTTISAFISANVSSKAAYVQNDTERSLFLATKNTTYEGFVVANVSAKSAYVENTTERTLFISTFNSTYDAIRGNTSNNSLYFSGQLPAYYLFNSTVSAYISANVSKTTNNSDYLDGQHGTFYLNITSGVVNAPISSNTWINTTNSANLSKIYNPIHCFDQACLKNMTYNGTNIIIYG